MLPLENQAELRQKVCGFEWQTGHPDYMNYSCVREPGHQGRHRSLRGAMKQNKDAA